ncbi:MAG: PAS domain S-box protein [Planctomycetota bacterium]|jgi:PAS domain S-box-containing protein
MQNEELLESNKRLQLVLECGNAGTWNWDVQAERIEWNEQMYEMVGLSPDVREITVETFFHYIHPKDLPRVQENIAKALKSGTDFKEMFRIVREDGEVRWLSGRGRVFRDEQAKPVRMMGVHIDITEHQQTAEAVRLERQKLRNMLDSIPDAVYIVNRQGEIEYVNLEMEKLHGPWAGKKCYQYRVGRNEPCPSCKFDQIQGGKTVRAEWTDERIGRTYDCIDAPLTNPDGSVSKLKIMRDVTEAKRAEEKLQQEHREIWLANRILEMFVNETGKTLYDKVLGLLLEAMKSQYGVFGYVDEQSSLICPTMSRVFDECEMADKCVCYTRDNWKGLWSRALLEKRTLYTNDPPVIPTGHMPIRNNLATPILFQGEVVGLFNFANKAGGYTEQDRRFIEAMAARIAPVLYAWVQRELREKEREQAEVALRETKNELERNVAQLRTTLDSLTEGLVISDLDGNLFHWNPAAVAMHGFSSIEECRRKLPEFAETFELSTEADGVLPVERWPLARILRGETLRNLEVHLRRHGSNWHRIFNYGGTLARDKTGKPLLAVVSCVDITERKQAENALRLHEARLEALLELNKMEGASRTEILDFVREEAIKITQSEFAFIGFMNEDESIMSTDSWSKEVMKQCAVVDQPIHFPMAEAGLWGEVVRQRRAIVVNDYPTHGGKRGYPEGHVPIKRFLSVPVFDRNRIVAVGAVANKQENYEESDVRALMSMMNDTWRLIQRRRVTEQIENLAKFPSENPNPVLRIAKNGVVLYANDASEPLLAEWGCHMGQTVPENWCRTVSDVFASGSAKRVEIEHADSVFAFMVVPVVEADYANLYGRDITERKRATEQIENLARFPSENPFPVLRIAEDGTILYSNDGGSALLSKWERQIGGLAPYDWCELIGEVLDSNQNKIIEAGYEQRIVSFVLAPVTKAGYVNIYGRDVTEQKKAEQALNEARDNLEEKVRQRTAELSDVVSALQKEARERSLAQQELQQSEARYRALVEQSPDPVSVVAGDKIAFANPACVGLAGLRSADELVGKEIWGFVHPDSHRAAETLLRAASRGREKIALTELKMLRPDGQTVEVEVSVAPIRYKGERAVQVVIRDITERKQTEARTHITKALFELFAQKTSKKEYLESVATIIHNWSGCRCVGIRLTNAEDYIPYESCVGFSREFLSEERMLCLNKDVCVCTRVVTRAPDPQDARAMTERGSFHCDDTSRFVESLTEAERARYRGACQKHGFASVAVVPIHYRRKTFGAIHLADEHENKVPLENVQFLENMATLIGEAVHRFNVEQELRLSKSRLVEAQRIAYLGNWDWDIVKNALWWSDEVYRIFGLKPQQFGATNEAFLACLHPDDRELVKAAVNEAVYNHKTYSIDHRVIRPDGTQRIVHERAKVLYDEEKRPIRMMGTVQDVTEFKRAEERILADQVALRSLTSELQLAEERERRRLARDVHDSLGQILAMSKREIVGLQKSAPAETAASLNAVANQLDQAVKEARTLSFELSPSVLYDLGFEVALEDLAERFSRERKIECRFENSDEPKPLEEAISVLLYRSVRELLINVAKHANATTVKVSLERIEDKLRITVEDNGDGFDVSTLDSLSRQPRGFGILSIRERLRHVGGHFEIRSGNGIGTTVTLIAPTRNEENTEQDRL